MEQKEETIGFSPAIHILRMEGDLESLRYLRRRITLCWMSNRKLMVLMYDVNEPRRFMQSMLEALHLQNHVQFEVFRVGFKRE